MQRPTGGSATSHLGRWDVAAGNPDVIADVVGKRCGGGGWVDADALYFYQRTIAQQRLELSSIINDAKVAFANL